MTRVRGFTQDDAHLFCTHEQVRGEFRATMELTQFVLGSLGLTDYRVRLSKHDPADPKYQGADGDIWRRAEEDIRGRARRDGPALRRGARRSRVLRSEGRLHRPRLHRPASGSSAPSSSTTSCPSGSVSSTSARTISRTGR